MSTAPQLAAPPPLTADLVARAVIAAAQAYGDDPIVAMSDCSPLQRRSRAAAASALAREAGLNVGVSARLLGTTKGTVAQARNKRLGGFVRAEMAARRAIEFAGWRPERTPAAVVQSSRTPDAGRRTPDAGRRTPRNPSRRRLSSANPHRHSPWPRLRSARP